MNLPPWGLPLILGLLAPALLHSAPFGEPMYEVRVNGQALALHDFPQGSFGLFELGRPADVEIRAHFDARWVVVRPLSYGIKAQVGPDHRTVHLRMRKPQDLTVEFNGDLGQVLHLFAYAPEKDVPNPGDPGLHYFGPGLHEAGVIDLKDGETLYLAPGAWVRGCVRSVNSRNVRIRGRGVLDGSGLDALRAASAPPNGSYGNPAYSLWNHNMVYFDKAVGASIEGITIFDSRAWTVLVRGCRTLHIDGIRILNPSVNYGDDGIDIVSSSDVLVENAFVRTNDDCVVVKNLDDVETNNIHVRHCVLWNMPAGGNALEVGFEMRNARTSDLLFENIDIIHVERGSAISIHNGDAAVVENVRYKDIRVEDARRKLIDFCVLYAQYGLDKASTQEERNRLMDRGGLWDGAQSFTEAERPERARFRGHVWDIRVQNLQVVDGALPFSIISGFDDDHRVDQVDIVGLSYLGRPLRTPADAKLVVEHARDVEIR